MIQNPPVAQSLPDEIAQAATVFQMGPLIGTIIANIILVVNYARSNSR